MRPRVDGVMFTSEVVSGIVNLHCLDCVDRVVRDDHRVVFFVRECMVAIGDI
jgi:hypothetical protein